MLPLKICLGFAVLLAAGTHVYGSVTTCQTPQDIHVGEPGTIKCSFPDRVDNKPFVIYKYDLNSTEYDEERVVNCYIANNQQLCDVSSGFDFTCTNGSEQTVSIPNVTNRHEGTYVCQPIPGDGECKPCVLKVKDQILEDKQNQERNEVINGDRVTEGKTGEKETSASVIAGVVCGVVIPTAACCVVGVIVYRMRKRGKTHRESNGADEEMVPHKTYLEDVYLNV